MKARTSLLIVFVAAVFVLATVSRGYATQTPSNQERTDKPSMTNDAGAQGETPRVGNTQQPVVVKHIGWSWLLITGLIGFVLGRITTRRRPYRRDEDIRRDRTA
jgi:hypothetical protein